MTTTTEESGRSLARRLLVTVYVPFVLTSLGRGMLVPVIPLYLREAGLSYTLVTVVVAASGLGAVLAGLPVGGAAQRFGPEWLFAVSTVVAGVAAALLGISTAVIALVAFHLAAGFGSVGLRIGVQMIINAAVPVRLRGRSMSMIGGGMRLAFFVGPILGGVLVDLVGFTLTFAACGAITVFGLVPFFASRPRGGAGRLERPVAPPSGLVSALRAHGGLLLLAGTGVSLVMTVRAGRNVIVPLIGDQLELSATAVGALVAIGTGADLLLFPVAGYLMDRFGRLAAIVPAFSLLGLGMLILGLAPSVAGAIVAGVVMGIGNGMSAGTMLTLGGDLAPADDSGPFLSALGMMQDLGVVIGPIIVGWLADTAGLEVSAIVLAVVMLVAVAWIVVVLGDTSRPSRPWVVSRLDVVARTTTRTLVP